MSNEEARNIHEWEHMPVNPPGRRNFENCDADVCLAARGAIAVPWPPTFEPRYLDLDDALTEAVEFMSGHKAGFCAAPCQHYGVLWELIASARAAPIATATPAERGT